MNTEIKSMKTCPGCDRHCPVGQFACGKGSKLFGQFEENTQAVNNNSMNQEYTKNQGHMVGKERRRGSHNHDRRSSSDHEEHRRHHHYDGPHHDKKWRNKEHRAVGSVSEQGSTPASSLPVVEHV